MARLGTPNINLGTWVDGENPGAGSQTVDNNGLNGNFLKLDRAIGTGHNADGSHKSGVIAGPNLIQTGAGAVVDGSTIEFSSNAMRVKDAGITGAKLASGVVDGTTLQLVANVMSVKTIGDAQISAVSGSKLTAGSVPTSALEYEEYVVLLTQTGGSAPTPTVLRNTLSVLPAWSYLGPGHYNCTLPALCTNANTFLLPGTVLSGGSGNPGTYGTIAPGTGVLYTFDNAGVAANGLLAATVVFIRYYP